MSFLQVPPLYNPLFILNLEQKMYLFSGVFYLMQSNSGYRAPPHVSCGHKAGGQWGSGIVDGALPQGSLPLLLLLGVRQYFLVLDSSVNYIVLFKIHNLPRSLRKGRGITIFVLCLWNKEIQSDDSILQGTLLLVFK